MEEQPSTCLGHPILYDNDIEDIEENVAREIMGSHDLRNIIAECLVTYLLAGRYSHRVAGKRTNPLYIFRTAHNIAKGVESEIITLTGLEAMLDWKNKERCKYATQDGKVNRLPLTLPRLQKYMTLLNKKVREIIDTPVPEVRKFRQIPKSEHSTRNPSRDNSDIHTDNIYDLLWDLDQTWYAPLKAVAILRLQVPDGEANDRTEYVLMKHIYHYMRWNVFLHLTQVYEHKALPRVYDPKVLTSGGLPAVLYREFLDQERGISKKKAADTKEAWKVITKMKEGMCMIDLSDNVITQPEPEGEEKKE